MRKPRSKSQSPTRPRRQAPPAPPAEVDPDEILPEYDFSRARPNKYAARFPAGGTLIILEPDVAAAFPDAAAVNDVLRTVAGIIRKHRPRGRAGRARPPRSA